MISQKDILSTIEMIDQQHLDIRTVTMGVSLLGCTDENVSKSCDKIYNKICRAAGQLVSVCEEIETEFGIPIVNKRISVTPVALVAAASEGEDDVPFALSLDRAAKECGVDFIGGVVQFVKLQAAAHHLNSQMVFFIEHNADRFVVHHQQRPPFGAACEFGAD